MDFRRPVRTDFVSAMNQTLRVWLISGCPAGTKAGGEARRAGIFVEPQTQRPKLRQERHHGGQPQDYAAPPGLKFILVWDSTNMPRLTALKTAAAK
jgi:hypothetical protein